VTHFVALYSLQEDDCIMQVIAHLTDYRDGHLENRIVALPDTATIADLCKELSKDLSFPMVAADHYYRVQNYGLYISERFIQYVVQDGKIVWSPREDEVTLADFFATHDIETREIHMRFNRGGWGGGFVLYHLAWEEVLKVLAYGVTLIEASKYGVKGGKSVGKAATYVRGKLWHRWKPPYRLADKSPGIVLSLIGQRPCWNASELAEMSGIPKEKVVFYLKGCGYRYDHQRQQYIASDVAPKQFERFNSLKLPAPPFDQIVTNARRKPYARKRRR